MIPIKKKDSHMLKKNLTTTIRFHKGKHDDIYEFLKKRPESTTNKAIMSIIEEYIEIKKVYKARKTSIRINLIENKIEAKIVDVKIIEEDKDG